MITPKEEKKHRLRLTLVFSIMVCLFFLTTTLIVGSVVYFMLRQGMLLPDEIHPQRFYIIRRILISSVLIGSVLAVVVSSIPLKPINEVINAMNRLAGGDYKTRMKVREEDHRFLHQHLIHRPSAMEEITESFNHLAQELENTEMLRSDFVNNFSHEFKTPIVSIAGFAKLLQKGNLTEEQKKEYIDIIVDESMRLSNMATNVMNLTRIENQEILTDVTSYNLSEQIRGCILLLEEKWSKKEIELQLEFDEHFVLGNEELMKQVWVNLLDNAIKFCDEKGIVKVNITETEEQMLVSISDTGPEIPEEARERIFRKFYQADESHSGEGNGIGLSVVKEIIKLHQGDITVSCGDHIVVFTVSIPRQRILG